MSRLPTKNRWHNVFTATDCSLRHLEAFFISTLFQAFRIGKSKRQRHWRTRNTRRQKNKKWSKKELVSGSLGRFPRVCHSLASQFFLFAYWNENLKQASSQGSCYSYTGHCQSGRFLKFPLIHMARHQFWLNNVPWRRIILFGWYPNFGVFINHTEHFRTAAFYEMIEIIKLYLWNKTRSNSFWEMYCTQILFFSAGKFSAPLWVPKSR